MSYSAAATMLVERGERCPRCGGRLSVEPNEPVAAAPPGDAARRRFTA